MCVVWYLGDGFPSLERLAVLLRLPLLDLAGLAHVARVDGDGVHGTGCPGGWHPHPHGRQGRGDNERGQATHSRRQAHGHGCGSDAARATHRPSHARRQRPRHTQSTEHHTPTSSHTQAAFECVKSGRWRGVMGVLVLFTGVTGAFHPLHRHIMALLTSKTTHAGVNGVPAEM